MTARYKQRDRLEVLHCKKFFVSVTDEDPIRKILGEIDSKLATGWDESKRACMADGNCKGKE